MSFRSVVTSSPRTMSVSEKRVLSVLLRDADAATFTAAEVAGRATTHESTVVRLAQKLGYRGYPELRADLARDAGTSTAAATVMRAASGHDLASFVADESRSLAVLPESVSQADVDAAAATVHGSRVVYLFSNSDERPALDILARRLRRLGKVVVPLGATAKDMAEHLVSFDAESTVIAFALREASVQLPAVVAEAHRKGGSTILITDVPGYHFRPAPTHLLAARRASDAEYNTLLTPIAICYAMQLAVYHLDPDHYQRVRDNIDDLTRLAGGVDEFPMRA
jgi:DNA-binding MurR/RpiR family transcriptional regulator